MENTRVERYTAYAQDSDMTFIMEDTYFTDDEGTEILKSTEVKGFYFGAPDNEHTEMAIGQLKAEF